MNIQVSLLNFLLICALACKPSLDKKEFTEELSAPIQEKETYQIFFEQYPAYHAKGFDYPVGKPNAKGYYNAQGFGKNEHLGDDWNAVTGGNSDLGDPIYSISHGYVEEVKDYGGGWGKVIRVIHYHKNLKPRYVESLYAHCDSTWVESGQAIKKGEQIATIGNADGVYLAHLHLEIRDSVGMPLGGGYGIDTLGYLDPTKFIKENREIVR